MEGKYNKEELRKEFNDLQQTFYKFVTDGQELSLKNLLNDHITLYDDKIRSEVIKNEEKFKKCKKIYKKLSRVKNKDLLNKSHFIHEIKKAIFAKEIVDEVNSFVFYPNESFEKIVENLNAVNELEHNKNPANVKEDIKALRKLPEFVFKELSLTRNLTPSNSHASVYKKYDMLTQITDESSKNGAFQNSLTLQQNTQDVPPNANKLFFNNSIGDKSKKDNFKR